MRGLAFLVPAVLLAAFLAGFWAPVTEPLGLTIGRRGPVPQTLTLRPGEGTTEAVRLLRALQSDPPPPLPPPPPPALPPPPPPPDIAVTFAAAIRGVSRDPQSGEVKVLLDGARQLGVGAVFADGWRVKEISGISVTLAKGRETRVIRLYGRT